MDLQSIYHKILSREAKTRKTSQELYQAYREDYLAGLHRQGLKPDPSYQEIAWHRDLIRSGKEPMEVPPNLHYQLTAI